MSDMSICFEHAFNIATSLMHPTNGKLVEDGITAYTLSTNTKVTLPSFVTLSEFSFLLIISDFSIFVLTFLILMLLPKLVLSTTGL